MRQTIKVPKAAEIIAQRIRKSIVRGEIGVGEYLPPEAQLLEAYQVSRPTLREAIRILEVEGLISISRGARRGARVERPSTDLVTKAAGIALQAQGATIGDVYQARSLIEPTAARLAAQRRPKMAGSALMAQFKVELEACDKCETGDLSYIRREIAVFHQVLMEQSGNKTLAMVAIALKELVDRHQALVYSRLRDEDLVGRVKRIRNGLRSHARLAKLVEQGDAAGAEKHWQEHMRLAGNVWLVEVAETSVVDILD